MENMNFEKFKKWAISVINKHMPQLQLELVDMEKLGGTYRGLVAKKENQKSSSVVNLTQMYHDYQNGKDLNEITVDMLGILYTQEAISLEWIYNYACVKEHLFIRVSNYQRNKEFLQKVPYTSVVDLVLTYHIRVDVKHGLTGNITITNEMLAKLNITKEKLHSDALKMSKILYPPYLMPLHTYLSRNTNTDISHLKKDKNVLVISNKSQNYGASTLFYPNVLEQISTMLGDDYYLVPSSIHEWIACCCDDESRYQLVVNTLREVNRRYVAEDEWLSDHLYHYDAKKHLFETAEYYREQQEIDHKMLN